MEAAYRSQRMEDEAAAYKEVPAKAFEVYRRINGLKPLYRGETMAYWMSLSVGGFSTLFPFLSCCPVSTLKELLTEAEELITFCLSMDDVIRNKMVELDYLQLPFELTQLQKCLTFGGHKQFDIKRESLRAWSEIPDIIQSPGFPFKAETNNESSFVGCQGISSPKSILAPNECSPETSSRSETSDTEDSNSESLSEQDISRFRGLLAFALESPQVPLKSVSKPSASWAPDSTHEVSSSNPLTANNMPYTMFPSVKYVPPNLPSASLSTASLPPLPMYPTMNTHPTQLYPSIRRPNVPAYPMIRNRAAAPRFPIKCLPPKTPSISSLPSSRKWTDQSPRYPPLPSPCLLFAACDKHLGCNNMQAGHCHPSPKMRVMKPPSFPSITSSAVPAQQGHNNGAFHNGNGSANWDSMLQNQFKLPAPVPHLPIEQHKFDFRKNVPNHNYYGGFSEQPNIKFPNNLHNGNYYGRCRNGPIVTESLPNIKFLDNLSNGYYGQRPNGWLPEQPNITIPNGFYGQNTNGSGINILPHQSTEVKPMINGCNGSIVQDPYSDYEQNENSRESVQLFENELQELLKGRRKPLRISILPAMYEERFHKPFNRSDEKLTALLQKCKNIILVLRPEGQHVIMLREDETVPATRASANRRARPNQSIDPKNRKIYLTFPPGSTFTSDDAEAYFRQFGPVRGIRMSHEEPPTYAFVEFYSPEGALSALCSTRAHYIVGQKVMVKPYKQSSANVK
eukprot:Gb_31294 [translate_table: standard]